MTENQKMFHVQDSSCNAEYPVRIHDININGGFERITFKYGEPTLLPYHKAVKFMQDGFTVIDADTSHVLANPAHTDETIRIRIGEDEIVAKYDELEVTALRLRAAVHPGGEIYVTKKATKAELIAFLKSATAPKGGDSETTDSMVDDTDEDEDGVGIKFDADDEQEDVDLTAPAPEPVTAPEPQPEPVVVVEPTPEVVEIPSENAGAVEEEAAAPAPEAGPAPTKK